MLGVVLSHCLQALGVRLPCPSQTLRHLRATCSSPISSLTPLLALTFFLRKPSLMSKEIQQLIYLGSRSLQEG